MKLMKSICAGIAVLLFLVGFAYLNRDQSVPQVPFDREVWSKNDDLDNRRLGMVEDLKRRLMGRTKTQVKEMLGEPRKDVAELHPGYEFTYLLGVVGKLYPDDGIWLCIQFRKDRVVSVLERGD